MTIGEIDIMASLVLSAEECRFLAEILVEADDGKDEALAEKIFTFASLFMAAAALTETYNNLRPGEAEDAFMSALEKSRLVKPKQALEG